MNIHQLNCFIAAANTLSFSEAARKSYISQSNISKNIDNLENELGVKLFYRTNKGVILTEEGNLLLQRATSIINQIDDLTNYYYLRKESIRELKISSLPISPVKNAIKKHLSNKVIIDFKETNRMEVIQNVIQNQSEIGFIMTSSLDPLRFQDIFKENHLSFTIIKQDDCNVYLNKNHPLANHLYLTFETLKDYHRIVFNLDKMTKNTVFEDVKHRVITNSVSLVKSIIESSNDYLIQTQWDKDIFENDNIISIPLRENHVKATIGYCYKKTYAFDEEITKILAEICYDINA